jgi:hypothetical protein
MQNSSETQIHSLYLFVMAALGLLFILISKYVLLSVAIYFFTLTIFFLNGLEPKSYLKILIAATLFSFTYFLLSQIYPAAELKDTLTFRLGWISFYHKSLNHGLLQVVRLGLLTSLSMASGLVVDYTKILMSFMQRKKIPLLLGYPIILALNSIVLLKNELNRIKMISFQRKLPLFTRIFPFFPLLVFAIRHSQRGALALVTRGLSENKTFYFNYQAQKSDRFFLLFFMLVYFTLVGLNFLVLK